MSKPIQEPTDQRKFRRQQYGIDQLFRRPSPAGVANTISIFRASRYDTDLGPIGTTDTTIDWDHWENCDETVFEPRDQSDNPDPVVGVDLVRFIRLKEPGRYCFSIKIHFTEAVDGAKIVLNDNDAVWTRGDDILTGPTHSYNTVGYVVGTWVAIYPIIDPFDTEWPDFSTGNFVPVFYGVGCIPTGANPDINEAHLEISYESEVTFCTTS